MPSRLCEDHIEKVSSDSGPISGLSTAILPGQDTFSVDGHLLSADFHRWIRVKAGAPPDVTGNSRHHGRRRHVYHEQCIGGTLPNEHD